MMSPPHASLSLVLTYKAVDTAVILAAEKIRELHHSWSEYRIPLDGIPDGDILRMEFRAELNQAYYHFVNLEGFYLIPR